MALWRSHRFVSAAILSCLCMALGSGLFADGQTRSSAGRITQLIPESRTEDASGAVVEIDGRSILTVYASVGGVSPEERAESIHQRILELARKRSIPTDVVRAEDRGAWTEILAKDDLLMDVTEADASAVGRSRPQLAAEYAEIIRRTVTTYRREHTLPVLLRGLLFTFLATAGLISVLLLLFRIRRVAKNRLERLVRRTEENLPAQSLRSPMARYFILPLVGTGVLAVTAATVVLLEIYATLVLRLFPSTRYLGFKMHRWTISELAGVGRVIWTYLPNLVIVVIILIAARSLIRLNKYIFEEIHEGTLTLPGFFPDWAKPTAKLVRLLILAATAVVIFPYLPGSNSPAFRGISVFIGVLLSLGSTSAVAHGVAGTILTYMRSFSVGDFVRIGDTVGEVVEKTLLVTRVCTQKNEIVTIPNGSVLGGVVVNYSSEARKRGVIFYTRVTIGYSAPWKRVHELLISAALATRDVLNSPEPFVLQASLNDFYVSYELNAFTNYPEHMQTIYSDLHQNIQDKFNEGGIEINSPHYTSLRDGNRLTIPEQFLSRDYREQPFVHEVRTTAVPKADEASDGASAQPRMPAA